MKTDNIEEQELDRLVVKINKYNNMAYIQKNSPLKHKGTHPGKDGHRSHIKAINKKDIPLSKQPATATDSLAIRIQHNYEVNKHSVGNWSDIAAKAKERYPTIDPKGYMNKDFKMRYNVKKGREKYGLDVNKSGYDYPELYKTYPTRFKKLSKEASPLNQDAKFNTTQHNYGKKAHKMTPKERSEDRRGRAVAVTAAASIFGMFNPPALGAKVAANVGPRVLMGMPKFKKGVNAAKKINKLNK